VRARANRAPGLEDFSMLHAGHTASCCKQQSQHRYGGPWGLRTTFPLQKDSNFEWFGFPSYEDF